MDKYNKRFIDNNYFRIDYDERDGREDYYDLSFGDHSSRAEITCHKNHLKNLLRELLSENFDYYSVCDICDKDINVGVEYYNLGGEHIHKECIDEYLDIAGGE